MALNSLCQYSIKRLLWGMLKLILLCSRCFTRGTGVLTRLSNLLIQNSGAGFLLSIEPGIPMIPISVLDSRPSVSTLFGRITGLPCPRRILSIGLPADRWSDTLHFTETLK